MEPYFMRISCSKKRLPVEIHAIKWVPLGSLVNNFENLVPSENILAEPRETLGDLFYCTDFY
jgi:hypothetical protein